MSVSQPWRGAGLRGAQVSASDDRAARAAGRARQVVLHVLGRLDVLAELDHHYVGLGVPVLPGHGQGGVLTETKYCSSSWPYLLCPAVREAADPRNPQSVGVASISTDVALRPAVVLQGKVISVPWTKRYLVGVDSTPESLRNPQLELHPILVTRLAYWGWGICQQ